MDNFSELNEKQLQAVYETEGPVLVLAGAGSGKTKVLTCRISYLIDHNKVDPYNILAITFTNKAALEMKERVENATKTNGVTISTFHSFCAKILRQDIYHLGDYTSSFTIYDADDSKKIITKIIKSMNLEMDKNFPKTVKDKISDAKNKGYSIDEYYKVIARESNAALIIDIFRKYEDEKRNNNALDFDDLLITTVELFRQYPEVLYKYQERYKYIHVDEFQDTNIYQYKFLWQLGNRYNNVFVVGDDDQSIYGWRGANYENVKNFQKHFMGCKVYKLEQNYRSTKRILDLANKVIVNNSNRMDKSLWTLGSEGAPISYKECPSDRDEADYVLQQIYSLKRNYGYNNEDFAILFRNASITRSMEEKLQLYNINFVKIGGEKFFDRAEVKDFIAYLNLIVNPKDNISFMRVVNTPKRGIGDATVDKLALNCNLRNMTLLEGLHNLDSLDLTSVEKNKLKSFLDVVVQLEANSSMPLEEYIDFVQATINLESMYNHETEEDDNRKSNIDDFVRGVKQYVQENKNGTLTEYLQSVVLLSSVDETVDKKDVLTLATIHGVKGLEYKCVFIIGLDDGVFPSLWNGYCENEEEERRLLYVAITRARERLYLTHARNRYRFGQIQDYAVSRFMKETGLIKEKTFDNDFEGNFVSRPSTFTSSYNRVKSEPLFVSRQVQPALKPKDLTQFTEGVKVKHTKFGEGTIVAVSGENADISFPGLGVKKFNMRLAPIEIVK